VAQAMARKFRWRVQLDGTPAMNLLGLSTQVPSQYVYQCDGPHRSYQAGKTSIIFRQTAPKEIGFKHEEGALIVQALKHCTKTRSRFFKQKSNVIALMETKHAID
jgi:hypothetical protein